MSTNYVILRYKGWQLYLQPKGADSLHRVDEQAEMRLHYSLDDFD
jgi:23S rRNA (uracil1939-C5)-methyltransferase